MGTPFSVEVRDLEEACGAFLRSVRTSYGETVTLTDGTMWWTDAPERFSFETVPAPGVTDLRDDVESLLEFKGVESLFVGELLAQIFARLAHK